MELKVLNQEGKSQGSVNLESKFFNAKYKESLVHQVVVAQLANRRQGTHSALTRSEVRGGGCKPYRQKGTGRARQGSIVAPNHVGGGIVFAKKPRDYRQKINEKMRYRAFASAMSEKIRQQELTIVAKLEFEAPSTKKLADTLKKLKLTGKTLIVLSREDSDLKWYEQVLLSSRNIPNVEVCDVDLLSVYDVVANKNVVITKTAIKRLDEEAIRLDFSHLIKE